MKVRITYTMALAALSCTMAMVGAGTASADDFTGRTYSDAQAAASQRNATPVVATVNGDQLDLDDCIVVSWRQSMFLDASNNGTERGDELLFNLNCNAAVAGPGKPGNSAATPEGRAAKKDQDDAEYFAENPDVCYESDANLAYCQRICKKTDLCDV